MIFFSIVTFLTGQWSLVWHEVSDIQGKSDRFPLSISFCLQALKCWIIYPYITTYFHKNSIFKDHLDFRHFLLQWICFSNFWVSFSIENAPEKRKEKKNKTLNQTSLCIKCGKFLRSLGTWSWDSRFAPYSSHLALSTGHCLGSSVWTCKDDLRLFIGETNRAAGASVFPSYSSISASFARPLFSVNVTQIYQTEANSADTAVTPPLDIGHRQVYWPVHFCQLFPYAGSRVGPETWLLRTASPQSKYCFEWRYWEPPNWF